MEPEPGPIPTTKVTRYNGREQAVRYGSGVGTSTAFWGGNCCSWQMLMICTRPR